MSKPLEIPADIEAVAAEVLRSTGSDQYGVTDRGFVPKPYARLLAEGLALSRELFGDDVDLAPGAVLRRLVELISLEQARTQADLAALYDSQFVVTAAGAALSSLGEELGLPRPPLAAHGEVTLTLGATLASEVEEVAIPRGARLLTAGGHHVATVEPIRLANNARTATVGVEAFYPGPEHNLDPAQPPQTIALWNPMDARLQPMFSRAEAAAMAPEAFVAIEHQAPLTGGDLMWPDDRYRDLILRAPRSLWTVDALRQVVALIPGVRQVQVHDAIGGLDIDRAIFGNFNFIERLFATERDLGSPYLFQVIVAPTPAAIWDGPDGLRAQILDAIDDIRPIGIFPEVGRAAEIGVGIVCDIVVKGLPLPSGDPQTVNASSPARELKARLLDRVRRYVDGLGFSEPVRHAQVTWALLNEPGIADVRNLKLLRYPSPTTGFAFHTAIAVVGPETLPVGQNVMLEPEQIAVFIDDDSGIVIV